jgi:hypothetical protein
MKKLLIIFAFLFIGIGLSAQKWNYLARPLPENLFVEKRISTTTGLRTLPRIVEKSSVTLFKLNGAISTGALTYDSEAKKLNPDIWVGAGPILSFRKYKPDETGVAYQVFGVGAGAILGASVTEINLGALKVVLLIEIGSRFSFGYGYAVVTNTPNLRHSILFNTRFDF